MEFFTKLFWGRIGRKHYLFAILFVIVISYVFAIGGVAAIEFLKSKLILPDYFSETAEVVFVWAMLILGYAGGVYLNVKRLHDIEAAGYWVLLMFVPFVDLFFSAVMFIRRGSIGPNKYGEPTHKMPFLKAIFNKQT